MTLFKFDRDHNIEHEALFAIYRSDGGECSGLSQAHEFVEVWPEPREHAGLGMGRVGFGSLGFGGVIEVLMDQQGLGYGGNLTNKGLGFGALGYFIETVEIDLHTQALTNGAYSWNMKLRDRAGNVSGDVISCVSDYVCNVPTAPKGATRDSNSEKNLTFSWS